MDQDNSKQSRRAEIVPAMERSVSYRVPADVMGLSANPDHGVSDQFYMRWANPTVAKLERKIARLEGGEAAICFSSGMAAISGLLLSMLKSGDHLVASNVSYPAGAELMDGVLAGFGVSTSRVDTSNPELVRNAIRPNTRLIYLETPANPILRLADIAAIGDIAKSARCPLIVDSTLATPVITRPLELGATHVLHSMTKYIGGHGDALGGVVVSSKEEIEQLRASALIHFGAALDPFAAWLFLRSLHTLEARVKLHTENARRVADFLEAHPSVQKVNYPGLRSHPQFELAQRQMAYSGGMISFVSKDAARLREKLASQAQIVSYAVSLGKAESLIYYIGSKETNEMSFRMDAENFAKYREWAGDGVFRLSVGLEPAQDLMNDLENCL